MILEMRVSMLNYRNKENLDRRVAELRREMSLSPDEPLVINPFAEPDLRKAMELEDLRDALLAEEEEG